MVKMAQTTEMIAICMFLFFYFLVVFIAFLPDIIDFWKYPKTINVNNLSFSSEVAMVSIKTRNGDTFTFKEGEYSRFNNTIKTEDIEINDFVSIITTLESNVVYKNKQFLYKKNNEGEFLYRLRDDLFYSDIVYKRKGNMMYKQ